MSSATWINGIPTCAWCLPGPATLPADGPGSHAWDLAEMRAQTERAIRAESALAREREAREKAERERDESEARLMLVMDWLKMEQGRHDAQGRGGQTAGGPYPPRLAPSALLELERLVSDAQGRYTANAVRTLAERAEAAEARLREVEDLAERWAANGAGQTPEVYAEELRRVLGGER
jgi:hypothetical protein